MITETCRFVALVVTAVDIPSTLDSKFPATSHLAAIAMLIADREADGTWRFTVEGKACRAGDGEDGLMDWLARTMPTDAVMLGWQLAEAIIPPLIDAASSGDPDICCTFIESLVMLLAAPSIDVAVPYGGARAMPMAMVAASYGIPVLSMQADAIESAWAFGDVASLEAQAESHAIAVWRLWLAEADGKGSPAASAFFAWLDHREAEHVSH